MIRQVLTRNPCNLSITVEVGTRDSAIRIEIFDHDLRLDDMRHWVHIPAQVAQPSPDLVMLYEYLKESGRVIHLTPDIAKQTIQFLKETN
ncbi:hypothetical protein ALEA_13 [Pseudomonas phage ALEA]|uniref:Uncharacterized protein n=1 Tax=Pseudomonas phage AH05 TaxID=2869574 RepID=A0AAE7X2F1_9CAUD|nr:hypothetical protein AH05_14 [Pseudomonas phage AH05]UAV89317.1 hypothetical protein ALEA_13 [Pseudomonas phage ALEA]UAV89416.1 hypothetical protein JOR_12 [Pseudomonas phage JOR]UAV89466.1 hypothetical protein M11_13 [Pseudomonas phage M1.1]UAV89515.1 hypothetical protein M12_12 [Pseudomonas phage M1.2]UAV89564.1 hypothetical protein M31_12 [Pseudomonas phage M3.1]UAV89787.1 hypothetical protein NOI_12 [Pseudomonas phage NOI]UAV90058.1 hypothetical protein SNK_12 [Pseudomonas phage SNK]